MSAELSPREAERQILARNAMVEYAAGSLSLHEGGITDPLLVYQVDAMGKTLRYTSSPDMLTLENGKPVTKLARLEETMGWGKSPFQALVAKNLGFGQMLGDNTPALPEGSQALQLVPTRYLKGQLHDDYVRFAPGLVEDGHVRIETYSYMWHAMQRGEFRPGQFPLILSDEAHRTLGSLTLRMLRRLQDGACNLGSSGTPKRNEEHSIARTLPDLIDRTTMREGILHEDKDYRFLGGIRVFTLHTGEEVRNVGRQVGNEYPLEAVQHLAASPERNGTIIDAALHGMLHTRGKGLIKCVPGNGQQHAQTIAQLLSNENYPGTSRKVNAIAIGSFNRQTERLIQQFKETDEIDALVYVKAVNEGLNVPDLAWGVWGMNSSSTTDVAQGMARGLRKSALPYFFYQVVDDVPTRFRQPVMAWAILGEQKEPEPGWLLAPNDVSHHAIEPPASPKTRRPNGPIIISAEASHIVDDAAGEHPIFFADALPPDDIDITHRSAKKLTDWTGLEETYLTRLLAVHGRRPASLTVIKGSIEHFYPADTETYLLESVALTGDLTIKESAIDLGISELTLRRRLKNVEQELQPIQLFPHEERLKIIKCAHLTPAQRTLLAARFNKERASDVSPALPIGEAARLLGKTFSATQAMLFNRGFKTTAVESSTNTDTTVQAYMRSEVEPWIEAFHAAGDMPKTGYKALTAIVRAAGVAYPTACIAARSAGIALPLFKTKRSPQEFVSDDDQGALLAAINTHTGKESKPGQTELKTSKNISENPSEPLHSRVEEQEVPARFTEVQLIRDSLRIPRLQQTTIRPHVTIGEIARQLRSYKLSAQDIQQYAAAKGHATISVDSVNFVSTADADALIDSYIGEHGSPNDVLEDTIDVAQRLRCSTSVINFLARNIHSIYEGLLKTDGSYKKWQQNVEAVFEEDRVRLSQNAIDILATFLASSGAAPRRSVFLGANLLKSSDEFDPRKSLPEALRKEMHVSVLRIPGKGYLQMVYGTPQVAHYRYSQKRDKLGA
ncbi:MAG TPA: hypothetical protein VLA92_04000 [Candidatus Saccharimonadales bacterium]|nr:hypothetical protein [Candidatus Saccharimonadales bacterium]